MGPQQGSEDKVWEAEEGSGRRGWGRLPEQTQSSGGVTRQAQRECSMTREWGFTFTQVKQRTEESEGAS